MDKKEYTFEVFNKNVRSYLAENTEHPEYSDFWGVGRSFTIRATSPSDAKTKMSKKYPIEKGFVVNPK